MKRFIAPIALAAAVLAVALPGAVTAAHATPLPGAITAAHGTPTSSNNRMQAVRMAKSYLSFQAFSLKGLVKQLKYEGFSKSDATYGASHSGANWMKQAVRMAKQYLRSMPFSRRGMIHQLQY